MKRVKTEYFIIFISIMAALSFWLLDAIIDYAEVHDQPFLSVLLLNKAEVSFRLLASSFFVLCGFFVAKFYSQQKHTEEELKKTQNYLQTIIETEPECVKLISRDGTLIHMNRAGLAMIDADSLEQVKGQPVNALILPEYRQEFKSLTEKTFAGVSGTMEFEVIGLKGRRLWLETHAVPVRNEKGEIFASLGMTRNVTDRKHAEEELMKHRERLEELVAKRTEEALKAAHLASIGELAAGVAHEINNPINGIINYAEILGNRLTNGTKEQEIAKRIIKEGDRIAVIVKSLLSFARERTETKGPVDVGNVLSETLTVTGAHLKKDGIILKKEIPHGLLEINANFQQIQQVFLNILNNARYALNQKYPSGHEKKILEIAGENVTVNGIPYVRVIFHDNGTGIPSKIIDKIMNPFFTTKPGDVGTGLGLSISHGIVKDHGGNIGIESEAGEFTRVIIDFPAKNGKGI